MDELAIQVDLKYVLAKDTVITDHKDLPQQRNNINLDLDNSEYLLSKHNSRITSKIISGDTRRLLNKFEQPSTILDAVISYAAESKIDAEQALESAYPPLRSLIIDRFIVDSTLAEEEKIKSKFKVGKFIDVYKVIEVIQVMEDVEVYKVFNSDVYYALKIPRVQNNDSNNLIKNEITVLRVLDGESSPRLIDDGIIDNCIYCVSEWVFGNTVEQIVENYRLFDFPGAKSKFKNICVSILKAYIDLHKKNIIHGDVHPRNIMINPDSRAYIIDYGLSILERAKDNDNPFPRAGVAFFLDPEYALARIEKRSSVPNVTKASEQYSIAALLYYLITGNHYIAFNVSEEIMLQQIVDSPMMSFESSSNASWPDMEKTLSIALNKDPGKRYLSLEYFLEAINKVAIDIELNSYYENNNSNKDYTVNGKIAQFISEISIPNCFELNGFKEGPKASIVFGAAGVAYALYRLSINNDDPELLSSADYWINYALVKMHDYDGLFNDSYEITPANVPETSFYFGKSGIYAVQALISKVSGDSYSLNGAITKYVELCNENDTGELMELYLGKAGVLLGYTMLLKLDTLNDLVLKCGNKIYSDIMESIIGKKITCSGLLFESYGMAHGWAGVVYSLLHWTRVTQQVPTKELRIVVNELFYKFEAKYGYNNFEALSAWWCGGSSGLIYFWTTAYSVFGETKYLELAKKLGMHACSDKSKIINLCCGLTGRAYSLLNLYNYDPDSIWLSQAESMASRIICDVGMLDRHRFSMFKGVSGIVLLSSDLRFPGRSDFLL